MTPYAEPLRPVDYLALYGNHADQSAMPFQIVMSDNETHLTPSHGLISQLDAARLRHDFNVFLALYSGDKYHPQTWVLGSVLEHAEPDPDTTGDLVYIIWA